MDRVLGTHVARHLLRPVGVAIAVGALTVAGLLGFPQRAASSAPPSTPSASADVPASPSINCPRLFGVVYACHVGKARNTPSISGGGQTYYQDDFRVALTPRGQPALYCNDNNDSSGAEAWMMFSGHGDSANYVALGYEADCFDPDQLWYVRKWLDNGSLHIDYLSPWPNNGSHRFRIRRQPGTPDTFHFYIDDVEYFSPLQLNGAYAEQKIMTVNYFPQFPPRLEFDSEVLATPTTCVTCTWPSWEATPFLLQTGMCYWATAPYSGTHWLSGDSRNHGSWVCGS